MPIDDNFRPNKRACYIPDPLPVDISIAYGEYVSTLTNYSDSPKVIVLTYDSPDTDYIISTDIIGHITDKRGYCSRRHSGTRCYKKSKFYCSAYSIKKRFINTTEMLDLSHI